MSDRSLCFRSARELASMIRTRKVSAREVMAAHLDQINRLNPTLNAIVAKLPDDRCVALADEADRQAARGGALGPLHGLPMAFKDLEAAKGFPFVRGSPVYRDTIATENSALVHRLLQAGAIAIGKTNVPEFGMGSHTYNKVYGTTVNPYDTTRTAGGSSGGAGAALAAGMLPIADGSDVGGSLRNPANFNNVVALRPGPGLVPSAPQPLPFVGFGVKGPMGRSVEDVAFLLSAMAGSDPRDPACYPSDAGRFAQPLDRSFNGTRVAWCPDLGGLPLDRRIRDVLESQRRTFEDLGCRVDEACPDLGDVDQAFRTIRHWMNAVSYGPLLAAHRDAMKPEVVFEIESGRALTADAVGRAMVAHGELLERMRRFQDTYEFMICAVNQVPPFAASIDWPKEIEGTPMVTYLDWMKSAYWISTTLRPAVSVPAGFTPEGLPVGVQIVGRFRDEFGVLQLAHAFEQATQFGLRRPPLI